MDDLIIFCAKYLIFVIALVCFFYWLTLNRKNKLELAVSVVVGGVIAYALIKIGGALYYHPRPFVTEHITPLVAHGNDNGFPSEHSTLAALAAMSVYFFNKKLGYTLLVLALLVAIGRVGAHVHSPVDVIAGLIFGVVAAQIGYDLARRRQLSSEKTKQ